MHIFGGGGGGWGICESFFRTDPARVAFKEPDPSAIEFYILKTGKSKGEGVLITHGDTFKFTKNNANRDGTLHYYACSMKLTHKCQARAIVQRSVIVGEKEEEEVMSELIEIATPEVSGILYYYFTFSSNSYHFVLLGAVSC